MAVYKRAKYGNSKHIERRRKKEKENQTTNMSQGTWPHYPPCVGGSCTDPVCCSHGNYSLS